MKKLIVLIPAYNESEIIEKNVLRLYEFLSKNMKKYDWRIVVSDNASIDKTPEIGKRLASKYQRIEYLRQPVRPLSYSIKMSWLKYSADYYMYIDADLSTDINYIPKLIAGLEAGNDIVIGSRTSKESSTSRSFSRNFISLVLIKITQILYSTKISDFQCGFKAINRKVRDKLIPKMKALGVGFISTELLAAAIKNKYKITELPIYWSDTRKSKSPIFKGIIDSLINLIRIKIDLIKGYYD